MQEGGRDEELRPYGVEHAQGRAQEVRPYAYGVGQGSKEIRPYGVGQGSRDDSGLMV